MKPSRHLVDVFEREIVASDGFALSARVFAPPSPRGAIVVHGATAAAQGYYAPFATHLAGRGFAVVTYDYRGVGRSRPISLAGFEARMRDWAELDARAVIAFARRELPGPLSMVGHSFGAQLVGLVDEAREVERAVFVGAQLGYLGHWPAAGRPRLGLFWYGLVPALTAVLGYLPAWGGLGEELPAGVAREWGRWCRSPGYYLDHEPAAAERLAAFDRPTLAYSFTDDDFAPAPAVDAFLDRLTTAPLTHERRSPYELGAAHVGHFGFFRPRFEGSLWPEVTRFFAGESLRGEAPFSLREPHLELALQAL